MHDGLGTAVRWPGDSHWWVRLGNRDSQPQRMPDHAVRGTGWRAARVVEDPPRLAHPPGEPGEVVYLPDDAFDK